MDKRLLCSRSFFARVRRYFSIPFPPERLCPIHTRRAANSARRSARRFSEMEADSFPKRASKSRKVPGFFFLLGTVRQPPDRRALSCHEISKRASNPPSPRLRRGRQSEAT